MYKFLQLIILWIHLCICSSSSFSLSSPQLCIWSRWSRKLSSHRRCKRPFTPFAALSTLLFASRPFQENHPQYLEFCSQFSESILYARHRGRRNRCIFLMFRKINNVFVFFFFISSKKDHLIHLVEFGQWASSFVLLDPNLQLRFEFFFSFFSFHLSSLYSSANTHLSSYPLRSSFVFVNSSHRPPTLLLSTNRFILLMLHRSRDLGLVGLLLSLLNSCGRSAHSSPRTSIGWWRNNHKDKQDQPRDDQIFFFLSPHLNLIQALFSSQKRSLKQLLHVYFFKHHYPSSRVFKSC